ncbi:class I SAM-dependent methyltransferase [Burkholderia multivorans]|uniref:methyltransferase domain-containing protein n=1 Tax=Burkholderia multivorans TaxID=87883 RepID=UPI00190779DB|nr:methyltransferase domain-containing protein [Burkholderia multivorans]MBJ9655271.1 methyltransferase domain-containing protein [Burkholderia multivorans]UQN68663.1 class I SAM-dependent methyltransferase [Burkholderia multivorans]UQN74390.1 class I SAM-dependent methyltransferase [Burkholderia multivorans]
MTREDETPAFWESFEKSDLALRCAILHRYRREVEEGKGAEEVHIVRRTLAQIFVKGYGIELGAGSRPFPIPTSATCYYGDIRDRTGLEKYFGTDKVTLSGEIDAQTLHGVPLDSLDFVISAHVIEHLLNPFGAIKQTIKRLKRGGVFLLVVPELTQTWDRRRQSTTIEHLLADEIDNGEGTYLQACIEHYRFIHPELTGEELPEYEIQKRAQILYEHRGNTHFHAWTEAAFYEMLIHLSRSAEFSIDARLSAVNENLYALRRL